MILERIKETMKWKKLRDWYSLNKGPKMRTTTSDFSHFWIVSAEQWKCVQNPKQRMLTKKLDWTKALLSENTDRCCQAFVTTTVYVLDRIVRTTTKSDTINKTKYTHALVELAKKQHQFPLTPLKIWLLLPGPSRQWWPSPGDVCQHRE